ncbi:MAG: helix-turn-helix transcriptional regulator [Clostridia bacterium]|nr:helix-turn-helix transcriptional regulator [Clostridia bacterium]
MDFGCTSLGESTKNAKAFDVSELNSAYYFSSKPHFDHRPEKYTVSQIFYIISGTGFIKSDLGTFPLYPGMMLYRPAFKESTYGWTSESASFAIINFVCDSPAMKAFEGAPLSLYEEESSTLLDVMKTTARICVPVKGKDGVERYVLKKDTSEVILGFIFSSLERFLSMVYCRLNGINILQDEAQKVNQYIGDSKQMSDVEAYLKEHIGMQLTIADVCEHFWISPNSLMKKFKKETGMGLMEYFSDLKIQEAKHLIAKTSLRFSEIAERLGFSSLNYFSKLFKAKTGMTPTEYSKFSSKRRAGVSGQKEE